MVEQKVSTSIVDNRRQIKDARNFGLSLSFILPTMIAIRLSTYTGTLFFQLCTLAFLLVITALYYPQFFLVPSHLWNKFGVLISKITLPVVFGIIFIFLFMPIGICLKLLKKQTLETQYLPQASTYWKKKERADYSVNMRNQF